MRTTFLGLFMVGLLAVSQGACGGASAAAKDAAIGGGDGSIGADGRFVPDTGPTSDGGQAGSFITGDVNGVRVRAEMTPASGTEGLADGMIWATAATTTRALGWTLYMNNSVGETDCPFAFVMLFDTAASVISNAPGVTCSVSVTAAAPAVGDVLEGTFTVMAPAMPPSVPETIQVTNGAFRVRRDRE